MTRITRITQITRITPLTDNRLNGCSGAGGIPLHHWGKLMNSGGNWHALGRRSRCQPKFRPTSTLAVLLFAQRKIAPVDFNPYRQASCQCKFASTSLCGTSSPTNAKLPREKFPSAPSSKPHQGKRHPSVAALQCYSSKTSNAKLKKKFILYIFIYIIIYINIYNMASFLECV